MKSLTLLILAILALLSFEAQARQKIMDQEEILFGKSDSLDRIIYFDWEADSDYGAISYLTPQLKFQSNKDWEVLGSLIATSTTKASHPCPTMTETQRNATTPNEGDCVFNQSANQINFYIDGAWAQVGGGGGGITEWTSNFQYAADDIAYDPALNQILRAQQDFTSTGAVDYANWFVMGPSVESADQNDIKGSSSDGTYNLKLLTEASKLLNRSFENGDITDWTVAGAVGTLNQANALGGFGDNALSVSPTGGAFQVEQNFSCNSYNGVNVGFKGWIKGNQIVDICYTSGGVKSGCTQYLGTGSYQPFFVSGTAVTGQNCGIDISYATATALFYLDNLEFESLIEREAITAISSDWQMVGTTTVTGTGSAPVKGVNPDVDEVWCMRDGPNMHVEYRFRSPNNGAGAGSGDYLWEIPDSCAGHSGLLIDTTKSGAYATVEGVGAFALDNSKGIALISNNVNSGEGGIVVYDDRHVRFFIQVDGAGSHGAVNSAMFNFNSGSAGHSFTAKFSVPIQGWGANETGVLSTANTVSSGSISYNFKTTAIDCSSDAVGTYNTFSVASGASAPALCSTAPVTAPSGVDGLLMYGRSAGAATTCNQPSRYEVCIGSGFKTVSLSAYQSAAKGGGPLETEIMLPSDGVQSGINRTYNEPDGKLTLNMHYIGTGSDSHFFKDMSGAGADVASGYVHFAAWRF